MYVVSVPVSITPDVSRHVFLPASAQKHKTSPGTSKHHDSMRLAAETCTHRGQEEAQLSKPTGSSGNNAAKRTAWFFVRDTDTDGSATAYRSHAENGMPN